MIKLPNPIVHEYANVIKYGKPYSLKDYAWKYLYYLILEKGKLDINIVYKRLKSIIESHDYDLDLIDNLIGALLMLFIMKKLGYYDESLGRIVINKAQKLRENLITKLTPRIPIYELDFALTLVTDNTEFEESLKKSGKLISRTYYFIARFLKYGSKDYNEVIEFLKSIERDIDKASIEECGLLLVLISLYSAERNNKVIPLLDKIIRRLYMLSPPHIVSDIPMELAYKVVLGFKKIGLHRVCVVPLRYLDKLKKLVTLLNKGYSVIEKDKISKIKTLTNIPLMVMSVIAVVSASISSLSHIINIPYSWISNILLIILLTVSLSILAYIRHLLPEKD